MERIDAPEPGIHKGIPIEVYLAWDLPSFHSLKEMLRSGKHYQASIANDIDTEALKVGRLVDCLIFEPAEYPKRFAAHPTTYENDKGERKKWTMAARACKEMVAQMEDAGRTVISERTFAEAAAYADAVKAHPAGKKLLADGGIAQPSLVVRDVETGVIYKNRPDWITADYAVDLKTAQAGDLRGFGLSIGRYQYHMQMAIQVDSWAALTGEELEPLFLVAEKSAAKAVAVYRLGIDSIEAGRQMFQRALLQYREAKASGVWHGYSDFIETIDAPHWALSGSLEVENVW